MGQGSDLDEAITAHSGVRAELMAERLMTQRAAIRVEARPSAKLSFHATGKNAIRPLPLANYKIGIYAYSSAVATNTAFSDTGESCPTMIHQAYRTVAGNL